MNRLGFLKGSLIESKRQRHPSPTTIDVNKCKYNSLAAATGSKEWKENHTPYTCIKIYKNQNGWNMWIKGLLRKSSQELLSNETATLLEEEEEEKTSSTASLTLTFMMYIPEKCWIESSREEGVKKKSRGNVAR